MGGCGVGGCQLSRLSYKHRVPSALADGSVDTVEVIGERHHHRPGRHEDGWRGVIDAYLSVVVVIR